ncbi:hypothetical protein B0H12DRAFT_1125804 [Mycena haematopus]|nr:hypothetical protein B0H12DRAFT_1125804 [Mycena haematopus]
MPALFSHLTRLHLFRTALPIPRNQFSTDHGRVLNSHPCDSHSNCRARGSLQDRGKIPNSLD